MNVARVEPTRIASSLGRWVVGWSAFALPPMHRRAHIARRKIIAIVACTGETEVVTVFQSIFFSGVPNVMWLNCRILAATHSRESSSTNSRERSMSLLLFLTFSFSVCLFLSRILTIDYVECIKTKVKNRFSANKASQRLLRQIKHAY